MAFPPDEDPGSPPAPMPPPPDPGPGITQHGPGLHIRLTRIPDLTKKGLLTRPFFFQCPPLETFTRSMQFSHNDYDSWRKGQFSRPGSMQLRSFTFNTLFVDYGAPWTLLSPLPINYDPNRDNAFMSLVPSPLVMNDHLEAILESGTPVYLYVSNPALWGRSEFPQGKLAVTLRTLEIEERAGELDARYTNVTFVEFRNPSIQTQDRGHKKGKLHLPASVLVRTLPASRDTMYELAKFYYGSAAKWRTIAKANGLTKLAASVNLKSYFHKQPKKKLLIPALRK